MTSTSSPCPPVWAAIRSRVVDGGLIGDDQADPGVLGGKSLRRTRPASARKHDVTGVGEADHGGPADPLEGAGEHDPSHGRWGCWPGEHGRGL